VAAPVAARRARDYLHAHAIEAVSLLTLATVVEQSPSQLIRVFRRSFGFTPHAYQTQRRIEIAKRLLAQGMAPATVAAATGFVDQSHMNLHFKRRVGVTPAVYRRAHFFQDEGPPRP
jgi:AraC-like DNA-binding protein